MEKEKNSKGLIIVLILIILGLTGYIVYDKFFTEETECPKCEKCEDTCDIEDDAEKPTLQDLACQAFEDLLKNDTSVSDYKINECNLFNQCNNTEDKIVLTVNYDITSPSQDRMWIAGNGEVDEASLTVRGKQNYVKVLKESDTYKADLDATGVTINSETGKSDICD